MSGIQKAWSPGQLATVIGMSKNFVLSEIHAGAIKAKMFGNRFRIMPSEVQRYITSHSFPPPDKKSEVDQKRA